MAMVQTKRLAALLLALLLTLFLLPSALADSGVVSGTTVSGTVRVYLSSISSLTAVDVSIAGSYSVGGDTSRALSRGQNIRVSNSGGTLMMTANGQTQTMGSRFKLRRHQTSGENGVRIAALDEMRYRRLLWDHTPLTDFWRVGKGIAQKLETHNMFTMGDVARCSLGGPQDFYNEEMLYRLFGVNAELLIDHAWGWEPCTIADIKAYKPAANSCGSGQVLHCATPADQARLIVREMADQLALDLVDKHLMTNQLVLTVGYDRENLTDPTRNAAYHGPVATDRYGRQIPKHAHGTTNLRQYTSSTRSILNAVTELFDRIVDKRLLVRRVNWWPAACWTKTPPVRRTAASSWTFSPSPKAPSSRPPPRKRSWIGSAGANKPCWPLKRSSGKMPSSRAWTCRSVPPPWSATHRSEGTRHDPPL